MAFASKLIDHLATAEACLPLFEPEYQAKLKALLDTIRPPIKEVNIGSGEKAVTIGGKVCLYRHELTWYRPTAIAIDVHDEMNRNELIKRVKDAESFIIERIGMKLVLNLIAVRCVSDNPEKFAETVGTVCENTQLPLILCSYNPSVIEKALMSVQGKKPLIYAANEKNWKELAVLAKEYKCPLAVSSPGDLPMLESLCKSLRGYGLDELVMDPGTYTDENFNETIDNFTMLRRDAIRNENKDVGYPLMAVPASVWISPEEEVATKMRESFLACSLMARYADLLIIHSMDPWVLLPVLVTRQSIYTDPRVPLSTKAGLYTTNNPTEKSPLFVTSNGALTYFLVRGDIEKSGNGWLICIDTGGISLQSSVAGKRFTAEMVVEALKGTSMDSKVNHRSIIIPGYAARVSGELEEMLPGWRVFVGPRESSDIPKFVESVWKKEIELKVVNHGKETS